MRRYTATLDIRISAGQREALDWWAGITGLSVAEIARHFLAVPHPSSLVDDWGPTDLWEQVNELREAADAILEEQIEEYLASGADRPGGER